MRAGCRVVANCLVLAYFGGVGKAYLSVNVDTKGSQMKNRDKLHAAYIPFGMTAELAGLAEEEDLKDVWALEDVLADLITAHDVERKMALYPRDYPEKPKSPRIKADYPRQKDLDRDGGRESRHVFCYYRKDDPHWGAIAPLAYPIPHVLRAMQNEQRKAEEYIAEGFTPIHGTMSIDGEPHEPEMSPEYLLRQDHILQIGNCRRSAVLRLVAKLQIRLDLQTADCEEEFDDFFAD